ncbi:unnamed protein product, partial [marine sediment metagenome]
MAYAPKDDHGLTEMQRAFVSAYAINPETCGKV